MTMPPPWEPPPWEPPPPGQAPWRGAGAEWGAVPGPETPPVPGRHAGHTGESAPADPADDDELDEDLLRPFIVTRGRSAPSVELRVETQLWARSEARGRGLRFEAQQIVQACRTPRSVAEVAVLLQMPLGVVRVLVADLIAENCLASEEAGQISVALLERIREGVLAL